MRKAFGFACIDVAVVAADFVVVVAAETIDWTEPDDERRVLAWFVFAFDPF